MNENTNSTVWADGEAASRLGHRLARRLLRLLLVLFVVRLLGSSFVFVDESEFVIVERLGSIRADGVYDRPEDRGLRFKLPWPIDTVRRFDRRLQIFDPPAREIFTQKKKNITVDTYICWRISESEQACSSLATDRPVVRFFRALGEIDAAELRLDTRVRGILSAQIGKVELSSLLAVEDSESGPQPGEQGLLEKLSEQVRRLVMQRPDENETLLERFGIEIVDVRIKRLNLPSGNQRAVFERMMSERKKDADAYRTEGLAQKRVIESQANRQYSAVLARARADAERIRGEGEARALEILNEAHAQDREFSHIVRTLDAYRQILNEKTTLVLSSSNHLLKLLTEGIPPPRQSPPEPSVPLKSSGKARSTDGVSEQPRPSAGSAENANGADKPKTSFDERYRSGSVSKTQGGLR